MSVMVEGDLQNENAANQVGTAPQRRLAHLIAPALTLQVCWVLLWLITARCWLSYSPSPLTGDWRSWDNPDIWGILHTSVALQYPPPPQPWQMALFVSVLLVASLQAVWAVLRARNISTPSRRAIWFVLGVTLVMGLTLVLLPILPSDDIYSYIMYGRIAAVYHTNPLLFTPNHFPGDPFLARVYWVDTRAVYGPVWLSVSTLLTYLAQALGGSAAVYVAVYKLFALACHLANAALIWGILSRWAPERRVLGTVLYAWNPLALFEFAAGGHNDALMLTFFLLGIWLLVQGREVAAMVAWGAAIGTKYVLLALIPLWLWQVALTVAPAAAEDWLLLWSRRAVAIGWRVLFLAAVLVLLMVPWWSGPATAQAFTASPSAQRLDNSLTDMLARYLPWLVSGVTHQQPIDLRQVLSIDTKMVGFVLFAAIWLYSLFRKAPRDLLTGWTLVLLGYLVLASGWFWPWYVTWPLVIVALRPLDKLTTAVLVLAAGVLGIYGFLPYLSAPIFGFRALFAFGPMLLTLIWMWLTPGNHQRSSSPRKLPSWLFGGNPETANEQIPSPSLLSE